MKRMMMSASRRGAFTLNVTASVASPNFRQMALNAGWNGNAPLVINITAPLVNTVRFFAGESYPQGVTLRIGAGARVGGVRGGGAAITTAVPITIDNLGIISGSGGSGGQGASISGSWAGVSKTSVGGSGSPGQGFQDSASLTIVPAGTGSAGQYVQFDNEVIGTNYPWIQAPQGGPGGSWGGPGGDGGATGSSGNGASITGTTSPATSGSYPGAAVAGNSLVTWINTGTRAGPLI